MGSEKEKLTRRKLRSSYIITIISISLVLFMFGLMGLLILNAKKLSNYVKENISFSVILNDDVKEVDIRSIQKTLDATAYVKATEFVTKEEAAIKLQKDLGEDFIDFLGYNPLLSSIDVYLYADYANPDSLAGIEKKFTNFPQVKEVFYQKSLVHLINENVRKISFILLIFSGMLLFIAIGLINNTIRLSVYSNRFIINTMQLVGASNGFIRKPFILKSMLHGLIGAIISIALLSGVIYMAQQEMNEIISFRDIDVLGILFLGVVTLGIFISIISTFFAINKYLRLKTEDLYY